MKPWHSRLKIPLLAACLLAAVASSFPFAGVSRVIQERYRSTYENKALFLKIPVFSVKQYVNIVGQTFRHEAAAGGTPLFKVGDQVRVLGIDFGGEEIKFKLGAITAPATVEMIFRFDAPLQENFPNSAVFDRSLAATFTEGLKFTDIDEAKRSFIEQEFDRTVREIASTSSTNRETVLKYVAPLLPAFQDATRENESLQNRNQELGRQLDKSHAENRKLDSEVRSQQAEITRLRSQAASLQEKIDNSTLQLSRLGEDLRSAKGVSQNYQRELSNLQRSLKIKVDPDRDLATQIAELGQAMQRIQKENSDLLAENGATRANLEKEQADNARLMGENQDLATKVRQKDETIKTLSSKEDSLAHQYLMLKQTKDHLENVSLSIANLRTQVVEENNEGGIRSGKINVYLGDTLLGSLEWSLPERLNTNEEKIAEAYFASESVDNVRLTSVERHIRESLGQRMKLNVKLASRSDSIGVTPENDGSPQEIGERDRAGWKWRLVNRGGPDSRLVLAANLINKNGDEIPLVQSEQQVLSSNLVRQVRNYLQPVSLGVGAILGSLLMCITGLFRRVRHAHPAKTQVESDRHYSGRKQL